MTISTKARYFTGAVFAVGVLVAASAHEGLAFRNVTFDALVANAGSVRQGQDVRLRFRFRNQGSLSATIVTVAPECGVWASVAGRPAVAPGEYGEIEARIDTSRLQGALVRSIVVTLKDPLERKISLTINGNVNPEFVVDRKVVDFGAIVNGSRARQEVSVRLNRTDYSLLNARSTDENFDAYLQRTENGEVVSVVVSARRTVRPGVKFGTVRISTSSPHMPELTVPVRGLWVADAP